MNISILVHSAYQCRLKHLLMLYKTDRDKKHHLLFKVYVKFVTTYN